MPTPRKARRWCRCCGEECKRPQAIYCSNCCQQEHAYLVRREEVLRRGSLEGCGHRFKRRFLRDQLDGRCEVCSRRTWRGQPIPLEVDHINGNPDDDRLFNLRYVCGNCAMQLPTYKSRNWGNGRHARSQRYADGKSYSD